MAWNEEWTYVVDGLNVNDLALYSCAIPELDNLMQRDIILAQIAGDWPAYIRSQPVEGRFTFNIALLGAGSSPVYRARIDNLRDVVFKQGPYHTLVVKARGMAATRSMDFLVEGGMADYTRRICSFRALAPKPVLE